MFISLISGLGPWDAMANNRNGGGVPVLLKLDGLGFRTFS